MGETAQSERSASVSQKGRGRGRGMNQSETSTQQEVHSTTRVYNIKTNDDHDDHEIIINYDVIIDFHPDKTNVVADALSQKTFAALRALDARLSMSECGALLAKLKLKSKLLDRFKDLQGKDDKCLKRMDQVKNEGNKDFEIRFDGNLYYRMRLVISDDEELNKDLLIEAHCSPLTMHHGENKMYMDLKSQYWWPGMKRDITEFVSKCLTYQQVKA
ncbi:uncharacterized protein LOC120122168 [Hibiscus syriacus]|uniref:uncharacterized protein LOC120122168 n=1 Tax=Hibiscus syriacus TaxID=106335 RepID=UPI001922396B|nr:uncharacterized protein LOC120122168 [Hibiscus syriacus]